MAVTYSSMSAVVVGTTTVAPPLPASLVNGDGVLIMIVTKPDTATIVTPTDWTLVCNVAGGGGTSGNGTGPTRQAWFFREKTAAWSTMPTVAITNGARSAAVSIRVTKTLAMWDVAASSGVYGTAATTTNASTAMGSDPGIITNDLILVGNSNQSSSPTWSAQAVTATGATFAVATELSEAIESANNPQVGGMLFRTSVTAGTATANATAASTASAATRGTVALIRVRDINPTIVTASDTLTVGLTEGQTQNRIPNPVSYGGTKAAPFTRPGTQDRVYNYGPYDGNDEYGIFNIPSGTTSEQIYSVQEALNPGGGQDLRMYAKNEITGVTLPSGQWRLWMKVSNPTVQLNINSIGVNIDRMNYVTGVFPGGGGVGFSHDSVVIPAGTGVTTILVDQGVLGARVMTTEEAFVMSSAGMNVTTSAAGTAGIAFVLDLPPLVHQFSSDDGAALSVADTGSKVATDVTLIAASDGASLTVSENVVKTVLTKSPVLHHTFESSNHGYNQNLVNAVTAIDGFTRNSGVNALAWQAPNGLSASSFSTTAYTLSSLGLSPGAEIFPTISVYADVPANSPGSFEWRIKFYDAGDVLLSGDAAGDIPFSMDTIWDTIDMPSAVIPQNAASMRFFFTRMGGANNNIVRLDDVKLQAFVPVFGGDAKAAADDAVIGVSETSSISIAVGVVASDTAAITTYDRADRAIAGQGNRLLDPSFEVGMDGWNVTLGSATLEAVSVPDAYDGTKVLRVTATATGNIHVNGPPSGYNLSITPWIGVSAYIRSVIGSGTITTYTITENLPGGTTAAPSSSVSVTTSWARHSKTYSNTTGHRFYPRFAWAATVGDVIEIDAATGNVMATNSLPAYDPVSSVSGRLVSDTAALSVTETSNVVAAAPTHPEFVGTTGGGNPGASGTIDVITHDSTQVGDKIIVQLNHGTGNLATDHTPPSGDWTMVGNRVADGGGGSWVWERTAAAAGAQTFTFTHATANDQTYTATTLRNVGAIGPSAQDSGGSPNSVAITTTSDNNMLLGLTALDGTAAMSFTSNMTNNRYDQTLTSSFMGMAVFTEEVSAAGAYTRQVTVTPTGSPHLHLIGISPAGPAAYPIVGSDNASITVSENAAFVATMSVKQYIADYYPSVAATGSELYVVPTTAQITTMKSVWAKVVSGDLSGANTEAASLGYEVTTFVDSDTGRTLRLLHEPTQSKYWGSYIWSPAGSGTKIGYAISHPKSDLNTHTMGADMFVADDAQFLFIAGAHRNANAAVDVNGDRVSDVANTLSSVFQGITEQTVANEQWVYIEPHGYADATHTTHDVVLSNGSATPPSSLYTLQTDMAASTGLRVDLYTGQAGHPLGATGNRQGAWIRSQGSLFLHAEVNSTSRTNVTTRASINNAITSWSAVTADSTAKSASDTSAISVADTAATAKSTTTTDTTALTVTEATAITKTIVASDTAALAITDISNVASTVPGTDSVAIGVAETVAIAVTTSATDAAALAIADTSSTSVSQSRTDTSTIAVTESQTIARTSASTESAAITVNDTSNLIVTISTTDTSALAISESSAAFKDITATDTAALTITETSAVLIDAALPGSDIIALGVADTASVEVFVSRTDNPTIGLTETSYILKTIGASDDAAISISETHTSLISLASTDASSLVVTEQTALFKDISASDSAAITATERRGITIVGATNLFRLRPEIDSSFESGANSVTVTGAGNVTTVVDAPDAPDGTKALRIEATTNGVIQIVTPRVAVMGNGNYNSSAYFKKISGSTMDIGLGYSAYSTAVIASSIQSGYGFLGAMSSEWGRKSISQQVPQNANYAALYVEINVVAGDVFLYDAYQFESGLNPTVYNPVTVASTEPKVANDTAALSVTESAQNFVTVSASDTSALTVTESRAIASSLSRADTAAISTADTSVRDNSLGQSDTAALSVTESVSILSTLSRADTTILSAFETTSSFREIYISDTSALAATEISAVVTDAFLPGSDTSALGVTDTASVAVFTTRTDSLVIGLTETQASALSTQSYDGGVIIGTESASLYSFSLISGTDGGALSLTETRAIDSTLSRTDGAALSINDASVSFRTMSASDTTALSVVDTGGNAVTLGANDTDDLAVSESVHLFRQGVRSEESLALTVNDSSTMFKNVTASDTTAIAVTESMGFESTLPGNETTVLGVVESVTINSYTTRTDSASIGLAEQAVVGVSLTTFDGTTIVLTDAGSLFLPKAATDGGTILLSEVASDSVIGAEVTSDTLTFSLSESATIHIGISGTDTTNLSVTESRATTVSQTRNDAIALSVSEGRTQQASLSRADSAALSVSENASSEQHQTFAAADTASLSVNETALISVTVASVDSTTVSVVESVSQSGSRPGADALRVGLTESVSIAVSVSTSETVGLTLTDAAETTLAVYAIDAGSVGVVEWSQAVGREDDSVAVVVFLDGAWRPGTIVRYSGGQWHTINAYAYKNGEWHSD